ncbi:MAG: type VI secretion system baseplate subunit TssG [Planctomycetota bacterium]
MADADRATARAVELFAAVAEAPWDYDYFQLLRQLECIHRDRPRLGESLRPSDDAIRLGQDPSLAFAPASLAQLEPATGQRPPRLLVQFFGLFGPQGPLPVHLTEYARSRRLVHHDNTFGRFADIFHHRFLSIFYRAWAKSQPTTSYDRPEEDRFRAYIGSFCGIGAASLQNRDAVSDDAKLALAGLYGCQTRHAAGLEGILASFFGVPAAVEQFVSQWLPLPAECRWQLGNADAARRGIGVLGELAVLGSHVEDCQLRFRVRLGPLDLATYERLLPGGASVERLTALVRNYIGWEFEVDLQLVLRKEDVSTVELGGPSRLGFTTWIANEPAARDAEELCVTVCH